MPDLLMDLDIARSEGTYRKVMAKYSTPVLLILDEWMLLKPTDTEQKDIFELLHRRRKKTRTFIIEYFNKSASKRTLFLYFLKICNARYSIFLETEK